MLKSLKRAAAFAIAASMALALQLPGYARWDKKVIACVGDSITFGTGSSYEAFNEKQEDTQETRSKFSYPARLQSYLGTSNFNVINFGMGGTTVIPGSGYVTTDDYDGGRVASQTYYADNALTATINHHRSSLNCKPDVVIMMFGTNDSNQSKAIKSGYANDDGTFSEEKWREAFKNGYKYLIDEYKALDSKPELYVMTTPHQASTTVMTDIVNVAVREVAAENGVTLIDLEKMMPMDSSGTSDGIHLNKWSYQKVGQLVDKQLKADHLNFDPVIKNGKNYLSISSDYAYDAMELFVAAYKDKQLLDVKKVIASVDYGTPYDVSLAWADALGADSVKVLTWDSQEPISAGRNVSLFEAAKNASGVSIIRGTSFMPGSNVTMLVRDADSKIVFADQVKSGSDGAYSFAANLGDGEYSVQIGNSQSNVLFRTLSLN